jgi:hypothetical protein
MISTRSDAIVSQHCCPRRCASALRKSCSHPMHILCPRGRSSTVRRDISLCVRCGRRDQNILCMFTSFKHSAQAATSLKGLAFIYAQEEEAAVAMGERMQNRKCCCLNNGPADRHV